MNTKIELQFKIEKLTDSIFAALSNPPRSVRAKIYQSTSTEVFKALDAEVRNAILDKIDTYND